MAKYDNHLASCTEDLCEIIAEEIAKIERGEDPIIFHRHLQHEQWMPRRWRSRDVQQVESMIKTVERICDKTGIFPDETVLGVLDRCARIAAVLLGTEQKKFLDEQQLVIDMRAELETFSAKQ